jgi:hypothetical protein
MDTRFEDTMDVVCGLCHWPYVYRDQDTMWAEKCDYCPAAAAVRSALGKEAGSHDDGPA